MRRSRRSARVQALLKQQRLYVDSIQLGNLPALRRHYREAILDLQGRLAHAMASAQGDTYTSQTYRLALIQLREGVEAMTARFGSTLALANDELAVEAPAVLAGHIAALEQVYTGHAPLLPIAQSAVFLGLSQNREASLMATHQASMSAWGSRLVELGQQQLALTLATNGTAWEAQQRIERVMDANWWQAERIARTEMSYAYSSAAQDAAVATKQQFLPDLWGRWEELIDDATGRPYDNRVAEDSMVLHGQVAPVGTPFYMPNDGRVQATLWGAAWSGPPNRPNDRASYGSWRPSWVDVKGWQCVAGARVEFTPERREAMRQSNEDLLRAHWLRAADAAA